MVMKQGDFFLSIFDVILSQEFYQGSLTERDSKLVINLYAKKWENIWMQGLFVT